MSKKRNKNLLDIYLRTGTFELYMHYTDNTWTKYNCTNTKLAINIGETCKSIITINLMRNDNKERDEIKNCSASAD